MFKYKVIGKGTYKGRFYSPQEAKAERRIIEVEKKLDPVPKWLQPVKSTTEAPSRVQKTSVAGTPLPKAPESKDFAGGKQEVL